MTCERRRTSDTECLVCRFFLRKNKNPKKNLRLRVLPDIWLTQYDNIFTIIVILALANFLTIPSNDIRQSLYRVRLPAEAHSLLVSYDTLGSYFFTFNIYLVLSPCIYDKKSKYIYFVYILNKILMLLYLNERIINLRSSNLVEFTIYMSRMYLQVYTYDTQQMHSYYSQVYISTYCA